MKNNRKYAVGVDIGGSHVCAAVVDFSGGEVIERSFVTRKVDNRWPASHIIRAWSAAISASVTGAGVKVAGIGVAMPGPFDYDRGISLIEGVDKFDSIFGLDVTHSLLAALAGTRIEKILYTNDAAAFALGEWLGGAGRGLRRVMALTVGTGFGSGFVVDGRLVTEAEGVPPNGWVYCLPFMGAVADDCFSTRWFVRRYRELTGGTVAGVKEIAENVGSESAAQQAIFDEYGRNLARFAEPLFGRFKGDAIVLGGNIARAFPLFHPAFLAYLAQHDTHIEMIPSRLGERAAIVCAASLFRDDKHY